MITAWRLASAGREHRAPGAATASSWPGGATVSPLSCPRPPQIHGPHPLPVSHVRRVSTCINHGIITCYDLHELSIARGLPILARGDKSGVSWHFSAVRSNYHQGIVGVDNSPFLHMYLHADTINRTQDLDLHLARLEFSLDGGASLSAYAMNQKTTGKKAKETRDKEPMTI